MAYDGIQHGSRVSNFGEAKLHAKVVDQVLNSTTYWSRLNGMGKKFSKPTMKYTLKIDRDEQGQFYTGLETLNSAGKDVTVQMEYAHTGFTQPVVDIMLESFANSGSEIDYHSFNVEDAEKEATQRLSTAAYGSGTGGQFNGLGNIVAATGTIGGLSRATYSELASTVTASGGTLSLSKLATLNDTVSDTGADEGTTVILTTYDIWSLYESLLQPTVRASYASVGYDKLPVRGKSAVKSADLKGAAGFDSLTYRGIPFIKDKACTAQTLFMLNENYLFWLGRTEVPSQYAGKLTPVNLGKASTLEGQMAMPSSYHGWFFQKEQMMPHQAGLIGRYHVIGQVACTQPRRQGKLTGITGV